MIKKYCKKSIVIEAIQWTGDNLKEIIQFTGRHESVQNMPWKYFEDLVKTDGLKIFTLEGVHLASVGDFIIKGIHGEFYPCKPDIFYETYDLV